MILTLIIVILIIAITYGTVEFYTERARKAREDAAEPAESNAWQLRLVHHLNYSGRHRGD